MRNHLKLALGTAAALALSIGVGCTHEEQGSGPYSPSSSNPPAYSTTNTGSSNYGNPGTGYEPTSHGGGPSSGASAGSKGGVDHHSGMPGESSSTSGTQSNGADDPGFDHGMGSGTGAMDNAPSGIGGGPLDKGSTTDKGVTNDDDSDTKLSPDGSDYKGKSDVAKPMKGKKGTTDKTVKPKSKSIKDKSGKSSGFDDSPSTGDGGAGGK